jgi:Fe-S-cluster containining protein
MIKIDCTNCNKCCGDEYFAPALLPFEEKKLGRFSKKLKTPFGDLLIVKRKKNGFCLFQDEKSKKCKIYSKRPIDCQLYPYYLKFNKGGEMEIILDKEVCTHTKENKKEKQRLFDFFKKYKIPKNYGKAYYFYMHTD